MHNYKYIHRASAFILLMTVMFLLTGCTQFLNKGVAQEEQPVRSKDQKREIIISKAQNMVTVYFSTTDNKNLVPVTLDVNPSEEMAKVATEKLLAGPSDQALRSPIPEGTKLKDLYKFDNIAYVDLTEDFLKAASESEAKTAVQALIFTLTEFPQVDSIQILINGKVPEKSYGNIDITKTLHKPDAINYYGKNEKNKYKVYYADSNALYLVPLTFSSNREITPELVISQLLEDPPKESNLGKSPIWPGTKLIDVEVKDGIAYANFTKEILGYGGGTANEINLVSSLIWTLADLPGINKVQLLVDGKKPAYLPEGTDTSRPWERPDRINYFPK